MLELHWLMRTAHLLAGAVWVGGSIMYLLVIVPALRVGEPAPKLSMAIATQFKRLTSLCIYVLLLSGGYLLFDRLTQTTLGWPYLVTLILKISVALAMFALAFYIGQNSARKIARQTTRFSQIAPQLMVVLGILVFILGALLNLLFEMTIAAK